jgi:thiamine pyrophosphate-dependent acetolactate synthase large subunit-like protein/nitrite reductase/ring-hydroxylating ferredoxin subunit
MPDCVHPNTTWHKVLSFDELPEGRVKTVTVGRRTLAVTHFDGGYGVLDNRCPHQGGPLGEGSIEHGWLRCPWHGYDYNPLTGEPPEGFSDRPACFATEVRDDGVYVALPPEPTRERTVSDVLVETMVNWGVTHVFGMVGHSNLGFADALREAEGRGDLTYVAIRHEGAAAFAASAYGKLTGGLAACFGIAGPGSTNLLTGLYDAKADRAPVLAISGQVPSKVKGRGAFQDLDLAAAFADVASYSHTVARGSDYAELMSLACKTALVEGDVAHLMLPDEVQVVPCDLPAGGPKGRTGAREVAPPDDVLEEAIARLARAERPMLIVGYGARFHMGPILELAESIGAPVATTFKAKGLISDSHPLGCGVLGRSGTPVASWFMNESDLVVVFGASFSNHTGIAEYKPIIQVDHDPMALGRFHSVDHPVLGDVGVVARIMRERFPADAACEDRAAQVAERCGTWREEKASRRADDSGAGVNSAAIFYSLSRLVDPDAVLCVDVGNNTYSFGRYFESERQSVLMSGYLGSIGFALPAALGAWAAVGGERQVVAVAGDGGFGQYAMELTTAVLHGMNITVVVLVNDELGKISKEQRGAELDVWATGLSNPDFARFAELCGGLGVRVREAAELDGALRRALDHEGPSLVHIGADALLV